MHMAWSMAVGLPAGVLPACALLALWDPLPCCNCDVRHHHIAVPGAGAPTLVVSTQVLCCYTRF
jgi:hypothetical protein